jgi:hypothetical protein
VKLSRTAVALAAVTMLLTTMSSPAVAEPPPDGPPPLTGDVGVDGPFSHSTGVPASSTDRESATAQLDIQVLDRAGTVPSGGQSRYVLILDVEDMSNYTTDLVDGAASVKVPHGTYSVAAFVLTAEADGRVSRTLAVDPLVEVSGDGAVVLDASRARHPIRVSVDREDAALRGGTVLFSQPGPGTDPWGDVFHPWYAFDLDPSGLNYVTPTEDVPGAALHVYSALTQAGAATSPYSYHLIDSTLGRVPRRPSYRHRTSGLAELVSRVAAQGRPGCAAFSPDMLLPGEAVGMGWSTVTGASPGSHTSYFTPGPHTWGLGLAYTGPDCDFGGPGSLDHFHSGQTFPAPGRYTEAWHTAPLGPALAGTNPVLPADVAEWFGPARREGDHLVFRIPLLVDSGANHWGQATPGWPAAGTSGWTMLLRDGEKVGASDVPGVGDFPVGAETARYRLVTESTRSVPWSDLATVQNVAWDFTSAPVEGDLPGQLPLLVVRYDLDLDDDGRAPAGQSYSFGVRVEHWTTAPVGTIETLTVDVSYDDGGTWHEVPLTADGGSWVASLDHPADAGYVSLRARAGDAAGNSVEQTVIRGYGLAD